MRILVTGANGQLGNEIRSIFESGRAEIGSLNGRYDGAIVDYTDQANLDIADKEAVTKWFDEHGPYDIVFNCAAYTNVDGCETNYDLALAVNAAAVGNLAEACEKQGAKFVEVSTDYVFPGIDPRPRVETDEVGPISAYGRTKLEGEKAAMQCCSRVFVVRTAWLYGYVGKNFVRTMLRLGVSHNQVTVVNDQLGNPTHANDLAYEMLELALTENYGIYHCTNEGTCSWADFAEAIMKQACPQCSVVRCTSEEYKKNNPQTANRPAYSSLENKRLAETIGNKMRPWEEALASFLKHVALEEG